MNLSTTNTLGMDERIKQGKKREAQVVALLNGEDVKLGDMWLHEWYQDFDATQADMRDKVDATVVGNGVVIPVQIKYRDDGPDVGVAAVRPFVDHKTFKKQWEAGKVPWDRDMVSKAKLLACLSSDGGILSVIPMEKLETGVYKMLGAYAGAPETNARSFKSDRCPGAELKVVRDKGSGYSAGQSKLIVYFTPALLKAAGGWVKHYYGSPEEMEPGR